MSEIDPVEFGKLIGSMQHLTTSITTLTEKVETLENKLNTGRGFILGLTIAAAGVGGSVGAYIHKIGDILK
jgi:hypothetical protein